MFRHGELAQVGIEEVRHHRLRLGEPLGHRPLAYGDVVGDRPHRCL
jgi:hypothetical protein